MNFLTLTIIRFLFITSTVLSPVFLFPAIAAEIDSTDYISGPTCWINHLENDLIPFWTTADKFNNVFFSSFRFDDGTVTNAENINEYIKIAKTRGGGDWLTDNADKLFIRTISRQTFAYGVAYHLTGKIKYFDMMKQGVDWLLENAFDENGAKTFSNEKNLNNE